MVDTQRSDLKAQRDQQGDGSLIILPGTQPMQNDPSHRSGYRQIDPKNLPRRGRLPTPIPSPPADREPPAPKPGP